MEEDDEVKGKKKKEKEWTLIEDEKKCSMCEEGKGEAGDPESVQNELHEVHTEEGSVHLASDVEDESGKDKWIEGKWVKGTICGVEQSERGSEAVGRGE